MDGYQFTAALFQSLVSLAWPAVVGLIAWTYKPNILGLLHRMNGTVKGFGLEFSLDAAGQTAKAVEAASAPMQATPSEPEITAGPHAPRPSSELSTGEATEDSPSKRVEPAASEPLAQQSVSWTLEEVAEMAPRHVFGETMFKIKEQLLDLYRDAGLRYEGPPLPRHIARQLERDGLIGSAIASLVRQLAEIALESQEQEPTSDQAARFIELAEAARNSLENTRLSLRLKRLAVGSPRFS